MIRMWDIGNGELINTLSDSGMGMVADIVALPGGEQAISASFDAVLRLWDLETGKVVRRFPGHLDNIWCVDVSADGRRAASGSQQSTTKIRDAIRLWDVSSGRQIATFDFDAIHDTPVLCVRFSPDGEYLYACNDEGLICRWRLPEEK